MPEQVDETILLSAEREWLLTGDDSVVTQVAAELPQHAERLGPGTLLIHFGNAVGRIELPCLGWVEVTSGKWGEDSFQRMLDELMEVAANLPFSAGEQPLLPFGMTAAEAPRIEYQAFVYLRHVLSDAAPRGSRLLPALALIVRDPYRRWVREPRRVPLEAMSRVDAGTVSALLKSPLHRAEDRGVASRGPLKRLADHLGGQLPTRVVESHVRSELDTQENRFVKRFLDQCLRIVGAAEDLARERGGAFGKRLLMDAQSCRLRLNRIRRDPLWEEVGVAHRLPVDSTVLRGRRGYRETLGHWVRLRRTAELLGLDDAADLLELKDIATLYELWCYFQVVNVARELLGPPVRTSRPVATPAEAKVEEEFAVEWKGVRISYNGRFRRGAGSRIRKAYSRLLRPDIVLEDRRFDPPVVHLLDAKFKVRSVNRRWAAPEDDRLLFKTADLHKMHAYRDAIRFAISAWVLYPGTELRSYRAPGSEGGGVGAVPLQPEGAVDDLRGVLEKLLARR